MVRPDIRFALSRIVSNAQISGIVGLEILVLAVLFGYFMQSWLIFGLSVVFLVLALYNKIFALLLLISLTGIWAYIGWMIGINFLHNFEASIITAGAGLLIGYFIHLPGLAAIRK